MVYDCRVVLSALAAVLALGTALDVYQRLRPFNSALFKNESPVDSQWVKILKLFSIYSNGKKVLDTEANQQHHLGCLNGIRTISMMWVVLGHTFLGVMFNQTVMKNRTFLANVIIKKTQRKYLDINSLYSLQAFTGGNGPSFEIILNALPSVDTFFFLSGLLVAYVTFIALEKKKFNIVVYYVHRYIRSGILYFA